MRNSLKLGMGFAAALTAVGPAMAADHQDGAGVLANPAADITDVYTWMSSDKSTINLIMNVYPGANSATLFSTATKYVFHTASQAGLLSTSSTKRDIICTFAGTTAPQTASCWITDGTTNVAEYATGNATTALTAADGKMKIFAGPRNDPFFFNLVGFRNATSAAAAAIKTGTGFIAGTDTAVPKCPILTKTARNTVAGYLGEDCAGSPLGTTVQPPRDFFKTPVTTESADCTTKPTDVTTQQTSNEGTSGSVLSLVVAVDTSLLTLGGSAVSVWGATTN